MIILKNISKVYDNKVVIKNVSYTFEEGIYQIVGKNGSGKSTIVKVIAQVIKPSSGKVIVKAKSIYLSEKFELPKDMTSLEFLKVFYPNQTVSELMDKYKIENKKIQKLSKGNKQKLGILYTLSYDHEICLLDEPFDGLDEEMIELICNYIKSIKENKCIIIISHILIDDYLDTKKIKIEDGKLCED